MAYFRTCPHCGSNLDPGEICDCQNKVEVKKRLPTFRELGELIEIRERQMTLLRQRKGA